MPIIDARPTGYTTPSQVTAPQAPAEVPFYETARAVFQLDNDVTNFIDLLGAPTFAAEPGFEPLKRLREEKVPEDDYEYLYGARSNGEFDWLRSKLAGERRNRATVQASGNVPWLVSEVAAGLLSPLNFLPLVGPASRLRLAGAALETAGQVAASEAVLQANQMTRTAEESAWNVAGSAFIVAGLHGISRGVRKILMDRAALPVASPREVPDVSRDAGGVASDRLKPTAGTFVLRKVEGSPEGHFDATGAVAERQHEAEVRVDNLLHVTPESIATIRREMGRKATLEEIVEWARVRGHDALAVEGFQDAQLRSNVEAGVVSDYGDQQRIPWDELDPADQMGLTGEGKAAAEVLEADLIDLRLRMARLNDAFEDQVRVFDLSKTRVGREATGESFDPVRFGEGVERQTEPETDEIGEAGMKAASVGAAAVERTSAGGLKGTLGAIRATAWMSPVTRVMAQNVSKRGRDVMAQFTSGGLMRERNIEGIESAPGGTIEGRIRTWKGAMYTAFGEGHEQFKAYRLRGGTWSELQFRTEITRALNLGGHEVPEVQKAAEAQAKVYREMGDAAVEVGLFDEKDRIQNYIRREYSREKIDADPLGFEATMARHRARALTSAYTDELAKLESRATRDAEYVADLRRPMPEAKEAVERLQLELEELPLSEGESVGRELRSRALELKRELRTKPPFEKRRALEQERAEALNAARGLEKEHAEVRRTRTGLRRRLRALSLEETAKPGRATEIESRVKRRRIEFEERWRQAGLEQAPAGPNFEEAAQGWARDFRLKVMAEPYRLGNVAVLEDVKATSGPRGSALRRTVDVPFEALAPWLELDSEKLGRTAVRTMAPDIEIARRFGDPGAKSALADLRLEETAVLENIQASKLSAEEKTRRTAEATKVFASVQRDLTGVIARARGKLGISTDPSGFAMRGGEVLQNLASVRYLGGVVVSSVPDVGRLVMKYGIKRVFRNAFLPLVRMGRTSAGLTRREARLTGAVIDAVSTSFNEMRSGELLQGMGRRSRVEQALEWASSRMGRLALFEQWTNVMKQMASMASVARMMDALQAQAEGRITAKEREWLASRNITGEHARVIWEQTQKSGNKVKGAWMPNTERWDAEASEALAVFRSALGDEMQDTIVTAGLERPLMMDKHPAARLLWQFKGFAMASMQKTLLAGLQARDAAALQGVVAMLGLGLLSEWMKVQVKGEKAVREARGEGIEWWAGRAVSNSGLLGPLQFGVDLTEPFVTGKASRGEALTGMTIPPALDTAQDIYQVMTEMRSPTRGTAERAVSVLPFNNVFYLKWLMQQVDATGRAAKALGLPKTRRQGLVPPG